MSKTILMLPSWYPSKENPFQGCFFREQALALTKNYNFVVAKYTTKAEIAFIYFIKKFLLLEKPKITFIQDDNGMKEYSIFSRKPRFILWDLLKDRLDIVLFHKVLPDGIGLIENSTTKKHRNYVVNYIKKHNLLPDFDCVYSLTSQDISPLGKVFSDIYNVPHVTAEHAPFPWPGKVITDSAAEAIEKADAFLAISNDKIRQVLLQNINVDPIWVGNLCDETKFVYKNEKHDIKTFLIVAANSFYKNLPLFIKSMEELKRISSVEFKIIIAGYNANKGYSKNAESLENAVKKSIINENTTLIQAVSRDKMSDLYNACDAFIMTSIQEGMPVSAIEASMCGLPVFSTRCGGVEDYIDDSMGCIFDLLDYKGIANACNDFLNNKIIFNNNEIRNKAVQYFGTESFINRMSSIFTDVINKYSI